MEYLDAQTVKYDSKKNPKVKVTLEFTANGESAEIEAQVTKILMNRYLEKEIKSYE